MDPDYPGTLDDPVGPGLHLVLEILVRRHARHVDAVARDVEFPAVIDAADSALLVASQKQRGAAVRAAMVHHADPACAVTKRDQLLAEQHQPDRRTVALKFGGLRGRNPVLPHQLAHYRSGADLR